MKMVWCNEESVRFFRWDGLLEAPVLTTITLGTHTVIDQYQRDPEGEDGATMRVIDKSKCQDCEPDCCQDGCSFNLTGSLMVMTGGPNEEGYSSSCTRYEFDGSELRRMVDTEGRDCDGRHGTHCEEVAETLEGHEWDGVFFPVWEELESRQYDQFAEMMNY